MAEERLKFVESQMKIETMEEKLKKAILKMSGLSERPRLKGNLKEKVNALCKETVNGENGVAKAKKKRPQCSGEKLVCLSATNFQTKPRWR